MIDNKSMKSPKQFLRDNNKVKSICGMTTTCSSFCKWKKGKVFKIIFVLICCGFCGFQTIDIFKKYASYPMDVNVMVEEMKLLPLPGITVCNNNIILKEKLMDKIHNFNEIMGNATLKQLSDFTKDYMKRTYLSQIFKISPKVELFVNGMECDTQFDPMDPNKDENKRCDYQDVIKSLQKNGICFTYFHKMAKYQVKDNSICNMMQTCAESNAALDANEMAIFELNFEPDQYTNKDLPISGKISIHDNSEIGNSLSNAYNLEPGYYYQFYIKLQSTSMLKKPYPTNCLDYVKNNSKLFETKSDYTSTLLSRKQCATLCVSKFAIRACNCWPPELPYTENNGLDPNKTLFWCTYKFDRTGKSYGQTLCYDKEKRLQCLVDCQSNCWTDNYEISVQKLSFEYYGRDGWDDKYKKCCAVVSIRYWTTERTIHKYSPLFTILDMVCYVGGIVSMYTGLSFVAIYDYLSISYVFIKRLYQG